MLDISRYLRAGVADIRLQQNMMLTALIILMLVVAFGVMLILKASQGLAPYEWIEDERILPGTGVKEQLNEWAKTHERQMAWLPWGVCLCILSVIPLFIGSMFGEAGALIGICGLLGVIALGVWLIVCSCYFRDVVDAVEGRGDYSPEELGFKQKYGSLLKIYWLVVTAIYLAWSFSTNWYSTWIIWPPAALVFAALVVGLKSHYKKQQSRTL